MNTHALVLPTQKIISYCVPGAIWTVESSVDVRRSTLTGNVARDAPDGCSTGGAIRLDGLSTLNVQHSTLMGNEAKQAGWWAYGGAISGVDQCTMNVSSSVLIDNVARNAGSARPECSAGGGAVHAETRSSVRIRNCTVTRNAASNAPEWARGGAIYGWSRTIIDVADSTLTPERCQQRR